MSEQSPESRRVPDEPQSITSHVSPGPNRTARAAQPPPLSLHQPPRLPFTESPKEDSPPQASPRPSPPSAYAAPNHNPYGVSPSPSQGYPPPYGYGQPSYHSPSYVVQSPTYREGAVNDTRWRVRPVIFVVGLLSLFLPFISVSCQGQTVATVTGVQMATGFEVNNTGTSARQQSTQRAGGEPMAVFALVVMIAGLALGFWHTQPSAVWSTIMGVAGVFALIRLKMKIDDDVLRQGSGLFQVDYRMGFWLLSTVFVVAIAYNLYLLGSTPEPVMATNSAYKTGPPY